jgi:hypothetical protein
MKQHWKYCRFPRPLCKILTNLKNWHLTTCKNCNLWWPWNCHLQASKKTFYVYFTEGFKGTLAQANDDTKGMHYLYIEYGQRQNGQSLLKVGVLPLLNYKVCVLPILLFYCFSYIEYRCAYSTTVVYQVHRPNFSTPYCMRII